MYTRLSRTLLVALLVGVTACGDGGSTVEDPGSTIQAYYEAFNAGDLDAVMALFTEESEVVGHPFSPHAQGLDEIRAVFALEVDGANHYMISNLRVTGDTVTWDHVYNDDYCRNGHTAVVDEGKIVSWTWPNTNSDCG